MLDQGRVVKSVTKTAWVSFASSANCAKCGACAQSESGTMINEADNQIGAKIGNLVEVEISPLVSTLFPLIVFGVPILFFFLGLGLGSLISELAGIMIGLILLLLGFVVVKMFELHVAGNKKYKSRIVRVLL